MMCVNVNEATPIKIKQPRATKKKTKKGHNCLLLCLQKKGV